MGSSLFGRATVAAVLLGVLVPVPAAAAPGGYQVVELGTLGGATGVAVAINERDEVAGTSSTEGFGQHAFRWSRGHMTDLAPLPGFQYSEGADINERGWVVGTSYRPDAWKATLWRGSTPVDIGPPGFQASQAIAVNDRGQVLGVAGELNEDHTIGSPAYRFLWHNGAVTLLGQQISNETTTALNNRGEVAGTFRIPPVTGECCTSGVIRAGTVVPLPDLGAGPGPYNNAARDINSRGDVVGWAAVGNGLSHAVIWRGGVVTDLGTLGGNRSFAMRVNDRGDVLGSSSSATANDQPTLWCNGRPINLTTRNIRTTDLLTDLNNRRHIVGFRDSRPVLFR